MKLVKHLKRDTISTNFIPEVDGMRFFAIITVVIYHLTTAYARQLEIDLNEYYGILNGSIEFGPGWWIKRFDIGVKVFFVISGFILAVPFTKYYVDKGNKIDLKQYFIRRLRRLEPPYIISLVLFFFVHLFFLEGDIYALGKSLLLGLFYLHTLILGHPNPINPVTWSLETEAQFYTLMPLVIALIFIFKRKAFIYSIFAVLFVLAIYSKNYVMRLGIGNLNSTLFVYFVNFLMGMFAAYLYVTKLKFFQRKNYAWDILHLVSIFLMFYFYKTQANIINIVVLNLSLLLFFVSVFKSRLWNWFYRRPIIYTIGGMCYSIYLLHYAFFHLSVKVTGISNLFDNELSNLAVQGAINIPLVLFISSIFFMLFEKPFMNKNWLLNLKSKLGYSK